jgi:hypothetical protein
MSIPSIHAYCRAILNGATVSGQFRKVPGFSTAAYWWSDFSMAAGNPPANFYASAPLVAERLGRWDSLFHGDDKAPSEQYLYRCALTSTSANMAGQYKLCDYLLYYPFVDMDSTDEQTFDNSKAILRYTTGDNVQVIAVSQAPTIGSGTFTFRYVNQDGVEKVSPLQYCGPSSAALGSIVTSQPASVAAIGPFLKLADNDTGVRRVISFTGVAANGGLCALVLVRPLMDFVLREAFTVCELELLSMRPGVVRVYDGAFLGFIVNATASVATNPLVGQLDFLWI